MRITLRQDWQSHRGELAHQNVTPGAEYYYFVLERCNGYYRIINDAGEPILYPRILFEVVDPEIPSTWIVDDDHESVGPRELAGRGFFEDYFNSDGDLAAQTTSRSLLRRVLERHIDIGDAKDRELLTRDLQRVIASWSR
jgi:hypothetical protein